MFSKFSTILQQAVDVLSPESTPVEDFLHHWKCITNFYVENTDEKCPVSSTDIPMHLNQMLAILVEEEAESGSTGPCMEYLLQHKLLETIHTLGRSDCPPGMKSQILRFFKSLLGRIQQPLLPHVNVHRPVSKLVKVCGEVAAAPTEPEEIAFLCTVCARLKQEPHLAHLFLTGKGQQKIKTAPIAVTKNNDSQESTEITLAKGNGGSQANICSISTKNADSALEKTTDSVDSHDSCDLHSYSVKTEGYNLVDSLLNLTKSEDGRVAVKACEGIMLLVSLDHKEAARAIVQDTALCYLLNLRLSSLFSSLPENMDPVDINSVEAKWGLDSRTDDGQKFLGKHALISFLSWFDYCDRLAAEGSTVECRKHLARSVREQFFENTLASLLCATSEHNILTATSIFTKLFRIVECKELLHEMLGFLLTEPGDEQNGPSLLLRLLARCDHLSDEIVIASLQLFETVLRKSDPMALEELVMKYLLDRGYHAENPGNIVIQTESTELEWDLEPGLEISADSPTDADMPTTQPELVVNVAKFNPRLHIQQAVNCYLNIMPEAAKSVQSLEDESEHDSYLREAHRMYRDVQSVCSRFKWPKEFESPGRCPAIGSFDEGPFLRMLLTKVSRILDQPYEVNLVVTSMASRLCLVPHPLLHEYFADPLTPTRPNARTLYTIVQQIITEMMARFTRFPNHKQKLLAARKALIGDNESPIRSVSGPSLERKNGNEHYFLLQGVIVLEEFCKELAAILFVKHHASIGT